MSAPSANAPDTVRTRIWDAPTRIVHWLSVVLMVAAWATAENHQWVLHRLAGYALFVLFLFRLYWGFAGSATARFKNFLRGPGAFLSYARKIFERPGHVTPGHNPMGGWSVVVMLSLIALVIGFGLFASDSQSVGPGPFAQAVGFKAARAAGELHETIFHVLLVLIILHVAVILFYVAYKRENLISAMVGGFKRLPRGETPPLQFSSGRHAAAAMFVALLIVAVIASADLFF
jgi:cytochrome b